MTGRVLGLGCRIEGWAVAVVGIVVLVWGLWIGWRLLGLGMCQGFGFGLEICFVLGVFFGTWDPRVPRGLI